MVRVPFDLGDGTTSHTGKKTATHAAIGAIGLYPLLDAVALDFGHLDTHQRTWRFTSPASRDDILRLIMNLNRFRNQLSLAVSRAESVKASVFLDDEQFVWAELRLCILLVFFY